MSSIADLWSKHPELPEADLRALLHDLWLLVVMERDERHGAQSFEELSFRDHCTRVLRKYRLEYQFLAMQAFRDRGTPFAFDESVLLRIQYALEKREAKQVIACVHELRRELKRLEWHRETKEINALKVGARFYSMVRGLVHDVVTVDDAGQSVESTECECRIRIEDGWICLDGKPLTEDVHQVGYVQVLVNAHPMRLTQREIVDHSDQLKSHDPAKLNRDVLRKLPKQLRELIDTTTGKGSCLSKDAWTS